MTPNSTTKLGISVFDQMFGGIYMHRPTILCGRRKSGKFVVATQLMVKTLLVGDRIILFTAKNPEEVIRAVQSDLIDLGEAVENGQLLICPYSSMRSSGCGPYAPLPFPQALDELTALVKNNDVSYAIFDSIVPWTAIHPLEAMQEHVDTFFATLDSLSLTSLLLLPEPASAASLSLATILREVCPINIEIAAKNFGAEFTMQVTKYQGLPGAAKKLPHKFALDLTPGVGFDSADAPRAKTISDLEAFASHSRAEEALKQRNAPAYRPFLASGLTSFTGASDQPKGESQKSKIMPGVAAPADAPLPSFAAATSKPAAPADAPFPSFAAATSKPAAPADAPFPSFAAATSKPATPADAPFPSFAAASSKPASAGAPFPSFAAATSKPTAPAGTPFPSFAAATSKPAPAGTPFPSFAAATGKTTAPAGTPFPSFAAATGKTTPPAGAPFPSFAAATGKTTPPAGAPLPTASAAPPTLDPPAAVPSGAQDGFSFASVIDMPEFPHAPQPQPAAHPKPSTADPSPQKVSGIQFSSVIR